MGLNARLPVCLLFSVLFHWVLLSSQFGRLVQHVGVQGVETDKAHGVPRNDVLAVTLVSSGISVSGDKAKRVEFAPVPSNDFGAEPRTENSGRQNGVGLSETAYVNASVLTRKPQIVWEPLLEFPSSADDDQAGKIVVRLLISKFGAVDEVIVESSELPMSFEDAVVSGFLGARFTPGEINGIAVASSIQIEIRFDSAIEERSGGDQR